MKKLLLANLIVLPLISTPVQSDILDDLSGFVTIDSHGHVDIYLEFDARNHRKPHRGYHHKPHRGYHHKPHRGHHHKPHRGHHHKPHRGHHHKPHRGHHHKPHRGHHHDPHHHHGPVVRHHPDYYNHDCRGPRCASGRWDDDWHRYDRYYRR